MIEYDAYYDEIKENGYWHGWLFVPIDNRDTLCSYLSRAREAVPFKYPLHFLNLGKSEPTDSLRVRLTESYISVGCAALQQCKFRSDPPKARVGGSAEIINPVKAKLTIYRVIGDVLKKNSNRNGLIAETLKSSLKGSLHYLFDGREKIAIRRIVFEGGDMQGINDQYIISVLRNQAWSHVVGLPDRFTYQSSDHNKSALGIRDDCQILQLSDLLVGATRYCVVSGERMKIRDKVSAPIFQLLDRADRHSAGLRRSRYYRGFSMSQAEKNGSAWEFKNLRINSGVASQQTRLFS